MPSLPSRERGLLTAARARLAGLRRGAGRTSRAGVGVVTGAALVASVVAAPELGAAVRAGELPAVERCGADTADRTYDVAAVNVHIPYNRWGQGNASGMVYVLQGDKSAVRDWHQPLGTTGDDRRLRPRPLVLRANEGECVRVEFTNELDADQAEGLPDDPRASMTVRGVQVDAQLSGGHVGWNDDSTVGRGESITYYWRAPLAEGAHVFTDGAVPAGAEADGGSLAHGLYGSFVVEPAGSRWLDPRSGAELYTGTSEQSGELYLDATIVPPRGRSFRETVQLAQDELPGTSGFAFNYGSEMQQARDAALCADCVGEETSLSSWAYGDPALVKLASGTGPWRPGSAESAEDCGLGTPGFDADSCFTANVTHAYTSDPLKVRFGQAGGKETHVFHMHAHSWLAEDEDVGAAGSTPTTPGPDRPAGSQTVDSQTFGPGEMFTADLLFGAGSRNGTVGDSVFHCHLYPHFAAGFWGLLRVHDVLEDGTGTLPDGTRVAAVQPLPDAAAPPAPTADNPGFPRFIPGRAGFRAPQPPLGVTDGGAPAPRYVAGRELDEASPAVAVETAVRQRLSGGTSTPGAPFSDPCPSGARQVTYDVTAIQLDVVYNERGDHDTQGRILVRSADVEDVLAGRKKPEPLFARVNAGDCVTWRLTNRLPNWFGNDAFVKAAQTNMFGQHIHLVKFDVLASDGASNGWNYQQAAFSRTYADFAAEQAGTDPVGPVCPVAACRMPLDTTYDPTTTSATVAPGQTITERWYADYELKTAFTHDHHFAALDQARGLYGALVVEPEGMDFRDPRTGVYYQPVNDPAHGPVCGAACTGTATGTAMDVIGPGPRDDFREFDTAVADFVSLTRAGGDPRTREGTVNAPDVPEVMPDEDPGTMAVNYRNAPLELRREKNGRPVDPAYVFSSTVFGDPATPVFNAYGGDPVRWRTIQGSQEEQHVMMVHGLRWQREPEDPKSPWVNAQPIGISEAFNVTLPRVSCGAGDDCRGDYLYTSGGVDDIANGMWGILRVHGGAVPGLLALPDNPQTRTGLVRQKSRDALTAPARTGPGAPCPTGAPVRAYDVVAMQATITYNEAGDHDPYGLVYALAADADAIRAGRNPEPLVLRANAGDCVEVTLTNRLTPEFAAHSGEGDAPVLGEADTTRTPGLRVSMHAALLDYDVRGSDGAAVGYNRDSTVGPGESMLYRWYAPEVANGELGAVTLSDYGDVRGHRHHGLYAGLVVEPKGSTWTDPVTGLAATGASADIRVPGRPDFREHVVFLSDGLNLRAVDGSLIADPFTLLPADGEAPDRLDAEDSGEKALGYRNEPFRHRLGGEPVVAAEPDARALASVYDSRRHGDPATPLLRSYTGDEVRVRVLQGADKPRQHSFSLLGSAWAAQPGDAQSRTTGVTSGLSVGVALNAHVGRTGPAGDYLYGDEVAFFHRSGGMWGLSRAYPAPDAASELTPTPLGAVDDPRAGGHPLLPLELDTVRVTAYDDADRDGTRDAGEPPVAGVSVRATSPAGAVAAGVSAADGTAVLGVRAGTHLLAVTAAEGLVAVAPATVTTGGDNDVVEVAVAVQPALAEPPPPVTKPRPGRPAPQPPTPVIPSPATVPAVRGTLPGSTTDRVVTAGVRWAPPRAGGTVRHYQVAALQVVRGRVVARTSSPLLSGRARSHRMRLPRGEYRFTVTAVTARGRHLSPASDRVTAR